MAASYASGAADQFWTKYNQRRTSKGAPLSPTEVASLYDPIGAYDYQTSMAAAERARLQENADRDFSLRDKAQKDAAKAGIVSGATGILSSAGNLYLGKKMYDAYTMKAPTSTPAIGGTGTDPAGASYFSAAEATPVEAAPTVATAYGAEAAPVASSFSAPTAAEAGYGLTTPAYSAPSLGVQTQLAGTGAAEGAGAQTVLASGGASASEAAAGSGMGEGLAATYGEGYGATAAGGATAAEGSTAAMGGMGVTGPATLAAMAGIYGPGLLKKATGMNDVWSKGIIRGPESFLGSAAGHVGGKTLQTIIDPVGRLGDAISDSVVCSELLRQGRISSRQREKCVVFRFRHIPDDMFMAYLEWAKPHVEAMRKGGWRNWIRLPFAHAFIGYMMAIQEKRYPTFAEKAVWNYAWRRCETIAHREMSGEKAVA